MHHTRLRQVYHRMMQIQLQHCMACFRGVTHAAHVLRPPAMVAPHLERESPQHTPRKNVPISPLFAAGLAAELRQNTASHRNNLQISETLPRLHAPAAFEAAASPTPVTFTRTGLRVSLLTADFMVFKTWAVSQGSLACLMRPRHTVGLCTRGKDLQFWIRNVCIGMHERSLKTIVS